jgi:hypothetical protein
MNARLLCIFAVACILTAGAPHAATQVDQPMKVLIERVEQSLRDFDKSTEGKPLTALAEEVYAFQSPQEPASQLRAFKARSLVRMLAALESKMDPRFDPNDPPARNISPPGHTYPSGVAPSSIKDEKQRREYEAALAANEAKAAIFERQTTLARNRDHVLTLLETLASDRTANPSEWLVELTSLLEQLRIRGDSRSRILKAVQRPTRQLLDQNL